jgi:uncharacterized membrane protein
MQPGFLGKTASIAGMILIVLGIVSLVYQVSPGRFLAQAINVEHRTNPVRPILGGLALVGGIALLFASRREG